MSSTEQVSSERRGVRAGVGVFRRIDPIWIILVALVVWMMSLSPLFTEPSVLLGVVQRGTPLIILAAGQYFVIASGEFDLSQGSLITAIVVLSSGLMSGDPSTLWWVLLLILALGIVVGLVNGIVTTYLGVPSILTTLGTLLILRGGAYQLSGGSPQGAFASNFRAPGRDAIENVPFLGQIPYAVLIMLAVGAIAAWLMRGTDFGPRLLAVGGNPRAAALSGVNVARERILAFLLSAVAAVVAGILLGGYAGESAQAGLGLELQSISAVVLGGVVIGGGRGKVPAAMAGALTLEVLFTVLNLLGLPSAIRNSVQGVIIIAALAYAGFRFGERR